MTDASIPMLTIVIAGVVSIVGSFAAGAVLIIKALHEVRVTTAKIEGHVNSEKTAAEGRETTLKRENELLREMLTGQKTTAALLAQAAATRTRPESPPEQS